MSLYYVANEIATTHKGMMIAIPESEGVIFSTMSSSELSETLIDLAHHVRLEAYRKIPTRPRKSLAKPKQSPKKGHVSTAKLLQNRKAISATP